MDQGSQENLKRILELTIPELTIEDKQFLFSRRSYLSRTQLEDYAEVLNFISRLNTSKDLPKNKKMVNPEPKKEASEESFDQKVENQVKQPEKEEVQELAKEQESTATQEGEAPSTESQESQVTEGNDTSSQEDECLDPDCQHDNENCPIFRANN